MRFLADGETLFDRKVCLGDPFLHRFLILRADQLGELNEVSLILSVHLRVVRPVLHRKLYFPLILRD